MDKIVGKIIIVGVLFFSESLSAHITLRALDFKGSVVQEVGVGIPCKIEVAIDGKSSMQPPVIHGLERARSGGRETTMQIVNGHSSVKHSYTVIFDHSGTYTIGPAEIKVQNQTLASPTITLIVTDTPSTPIPAASATTGKKDVANSFFARLLVDKQHIVVGERLYCTLQIWSAQPGSSLQEIVPPPFENFMVVSRTGPTSSTKMHKGVNYTCLEWQWCLSAQKAQSPLVIPAFRIEYCVPLEDDDEGFDHLASFFGPRLKRKRAYSNSLSIEAVDMPPYNGIVHGIGQFKRFSAHAHPAVAKEGDGIVLTLELEGSGDVYENVAPTLIDMPAALKWYASKVCTVDPSADNELPKKCFEYIVQGMASGTWEIPSQAFTYFDVMSKKYVTLQTSAVVVTILPRIAPSKVGPVVNDQNPPDGHNAGDDNEYDIRPLHTDTWYIQRERYLPFWVFIVLFIAPVVCITMRSMRKTFADYMVKKSGNNRRIRAFIRARKQLKFAESEQNFTKIYPIFIELLAVRCGVSYGEISEDTIEALLRKKGINDIRYGQWHSFFATIAALVFAGQSKVSIAPQDIFTQSYAWIDLLEEIL